MAAGGFSAGLNLRVTPYAWPISDQAGLPTVSAGDLR